MLTIRLNRAGKNKRASFRIAVQEHTVAPGGRHVEIVGSYDPHTKKAVLKAERIKYWISKGAQVSDSAYNLFVKEKVIEGKKREVKIPKPAAPEAAPAPAEEKPAEEAKAEEAPKGEAEAEELKADSTSSPQAEEAPAEAVEEEAPAAEVPKGE